MNEVIKLIEEFISCKSFTKSNVNKAVEIAESTLKDWNIKTDVISNKGYKMLVASVGEGDRTIILNGHLDVVPANSEQYIPKIENGKLCGRGSYDMLGAAAVMMNIMKDLAIEEPKVKILLMLVSTEETDGSICTKYLLEKGYIGDFAICGEPTNLKVSIMSKGVLQLRISIHGKSAHSSRPWSGENALLKAFEIFNKIKSLPFTKIENEFFKEPSINLSKIVGGNVINKVPDFAEIEIDIRYLPGQNSEKIVEQIKSLDESMDIEILQKGSAVYVATENYFVQKLVEEAKKYVIDKDIITAQHGTADTRFFYDVGIPSVEFGPVGKNHHGNNEYVDIESLFIYKKVLMNFIKEVGREERTD